MSMGDEKGWKNRENVRVVVVTGLSGSGKSTAIKAFEDLDFFCVDNLPVVLLPDFLQLREEATEDLLNIALGMDIREGHFLESYPEIFANLWQRGTNLEILFLEATEEILLRRFSQTRRKHPLAGSDKVSDGIRAERESLKDLKRMATRVLDTSNTNVHELKRIISSLYAIWPQWETLHVNMLSFGFKYGVPTEADVVMDVRFLPNPFFVRELRDLDGSNEPVIQFVMQQEQTQLFLDKFTDLINYLLPRYREEGKSYLTIAIGCTGGRHRSVVISQQLRERLTERGYSVSAEHRDVEMD
jgi:UPF0042 nucleotide-binding protein